MKRKTKPKPATAGEKIEMKRFGLTLFDVRTRGPAKRAAAIDRAIARAVRKERERCTKHALDSYIMQEDGWQAWQDIEKGTPV